MFKKLKRKTGIPVSAHRLRHSFALSYIEAGGNLRYLQKILGHTDIATTCIYVNPTIDHLRLQHDQFSPGDRI